MSIIQWNICGIRANQEHIRVLFKETGASVICLQETKLGESPLNPGINYVFL